MPAHRNQLETLNSNAIKDHPIVRDLPREKFSFSEILRLKIFWILENLKIEKISNFEKMTKIDTPSLRLATKVENMSSLAAVAHPRDLIPPWETFLPQDGEGLASPSGF
jgi:hypothetical protein